MRGAILFFAGIVAVVPSARIAAQEYVNTAVERLQAESPYSEIILVSIGLIGILLLLLMRQPAPERTIVYRVRTEMPGPKGLVAERRPREEARPARKAPALKRDRTPSIGWFPRLRRIFSQQMGARLS